MLKSLIQYLIIFFFSKKIKMKYNIEISGERIIIDLNLLSEQPRKENELVILLYNVESKSSILSDGTLKKENFFSFEIIYFNKGLWYSFSSRNLLSQKIIINLIGWYYPFPTSIEKHVVADQK